MLELAPNDPIIKTYVKEIHHLKTDQAIVHELGLKGPFQNLLDKAARRRGWTLVPELSTWSGGKRVIPDGTVCDEFRLARGWWEAKDTGDKLAAEIQKKLKLGYPARNTIFEDTSTAVLYQDRSEAGEYPLSEPLGVATLLNRFLSHDETDEREFERAMAEFRSRIPDLAQSLHEHIQDAHKLNTKFRRAFSEFVLLCRTSLNPDLSEAKVDEMLIQHLLTERLMRNLFQNPEFSRRNVIAAQVEKVIEALPPPAFPAPSFCASSIRTTKPSNAPERTSATSRKSRIFSTPFTSSFSAGSRPISRILTESSTLRARSSITCAIRSKRRSKEEFGLTLASSEVVILDPCTGTGNFMVSLIERIPGRALDEAYKKRLFANEVMLLPYYVASLNIEHAFYERMKRYESFEGLCFVDTLDMAEDRQFEMFAPANTQRIEEEKKAAMTVIIGNPPYNVGQKSENDNNQNRKYKIVDRRIRETYAKDSKATNKNSLSDMYVKFFRWATDRLGDRDGIVCFVSNNSFVDQIAFDGMRKHLMQGFQRIDHVDLHGNVRRNPKLSGTTHNVFGIQVGVGITLAVRKKGAVPRLRYYRVPESWRKAEKLEFLATKNIELRELTPDKSNTWLVPGNAEEFGALTRIADVFELRTRGLQTTRDDVVYDWDRARLAARIEAFVESYNTEVHRRKSNPRATWPEHIDWSRDLKQDAMRGRLAEFDPSKIRPALYRPYVHKWVFFDRILNEEIYQWPRIAGRVIVISDIAWRAPHFNVIMADCIADLHVCAPVDAHQCFPLSHLSDSALELFRRHYSDDSIGKEDIFNYIYALLHHPGYRERYAANLKRELPRIPFAADFHAFAAAGRELAHLHVDYESLDSWPFEYIENKRVPYSERVTKMKLSPDRTAVFVNESLTLRGIPPEAFEYRLGSRSALEWIVDQYRVKGDSDPNRAEDPGYIIRLVRQVVRVSVETVRIARNLPAFR